MNSILRLCSTAILIGPAAAQTTGASAAAVTDLWVRSPMSSQVARAPRDLTSGLLLELTQPGMFVRMQVTCDHGPTTGTRYRILDHWQVLSTYAGPHGAFSTGAHSTLLRLTASQPIQGRLVIGAASVVRNASTIVGRVDVRDDGSDEFVVIPGPYQEIELPLTVTPAGVVIKTTTGTAGSTDGAPNQWWTAKVDLSISFLPAERCRGERIGDTCGPTITIAPTFAGDLAVDLGTSANNATAALLLGTSALLVPLPPPFCGFLTTDPVVILHQPFVGGSARFVLPLPAGLANLLFRTQGAAVYVDGGGMLRVPLTWGLRVTCP